MKPEISLVEPMLSMDDAQAERDFGGYQGRTREIGSLDGLL